MAINRCTSSGCERPFQVNGFSGSFAESAHLPVGKIICPHCGKVSAGDRYSTYVTHALSAEEECRFTHREAA